MKILLVEDDEATAAHVSAGLRQHRHVVDLASTGREGVLLASTRSYNVIILDRMLPGMDGLAIVKTIRASGVKTAVLLLTALDGVGDRVDGLEAGGDDYLVKPFAFAELLARVSALARRAPPVDAPTFLRVADLELDLLRRTVARGGKRIELQPQEFRLLEYLVRRAGCVVTRAMLLESVWDFHFDPKTTVVETHISRLRGKIDQGYEHPLIHTIRGAGYCLRGTD